MDENTVRKIESQVPGKSRIPQANGLNELNPSLANIRSGIVPPRTILASATDKSSCITQPARSGLGKPEASEERKWKRSRLAKGVTKSHSKNASSHTSRNTQIEAFSAMGAPARPSSTRGTMRPHTSNSHQAALSARRPGTSFDTYHDDSSSTTIRKRKGWESDRIEVMEQFYDDLLERMNQTGSECYGLKEAVELYKTRVSELETARQELSEANLSLRVELETMNGRIAVAEHALTQANRAHELSMDDTGRRFRIETENIRHESSKEMHTLLLTHKDELRKLKRRCDDELEDDRARRKRELDQIISQHTAECQRTQLELESKDRQIARLQEDLHTAREELERECRKTRDLHQNLDTANSNGLTLDSSIRALKARVEFLESGSKEQSEAFSRLDQQLLDAISEARDAKQKLRKEETLRRKLHNQIQELRGNIRVFCRVRPPLDVDTANGVVQISFPDEGMDSKELSVVGPEERSSLGVVARKNKSFTFDRVFGPGTQNSDVFEEVSQLVQSALDGYNVCIFCYGQTGSGKTYTMSSEDGMIPRAVHQIYNTAKDLEEKGWKYSMEGNFVEVYNENLNDLLGKAEEFDKKRHEIRHDMQKCKTTITDITTVTLDSPEIVESILRRATTNRSVAATKANERSSRSHSVFILKLLGENSMTGERSEGTLNLVDLAGSERLSHSGATGDRLKETQNINRSLSCLGDVINALGQEKEGTHIPYRNSKAFSIPSLFIRITF